MIFFGVDGVGNSRKKTSYRSTGVSASIYPGPGGSSPFLANGAAFRWADSIDRPETLGSWRLFRGLGSPRVRRGQYGDQADGRIDDDGDTWPVPVYAKPDVSGHDPGSDRHLRIAGQPVAMDTDPGVHFSDPAIIHHS